MGTFALIALIAIIAILSSAFGAYIGAMIAAGTIAIKISEPLHDNKRSRNLEVTHPIH